MNQNQESQKVEIFCETSFSPTNLEKKCRSSVESICENFSIRNISGPPMGFPKDIDDFLQRADVTDYTRGQVYRLWKVRESGGISIDSDVLLLENIDQFAGRGFFAAGAGGHILSCIFGGEPGDHGLTMALKYLSLMIEMSPETVIKWQKTGEEGGVCGALFLWLVRNGDKRLILPTYCFNLFGAPPVAQAFAASDSVARERFKNGARGMIGSEFPIFGMFVNQKMFRPRIPVQPAADIIEDPSPPQPKQQPRVEASIPQMGMSFGKALLDAGKDIVHGRKALASKEEKEARLNTCGGCEFFIKESGRCSKCGCVMTLKASMASAACPIGKWTKSEGH
jgi:hypothetical protein